MHPLPERVLQFGTGILLRGLPDYFIHKANQQKIFNGSILVVKSTPGDADDFAAGYTTIVRGIEQGVEIREEFVNTAISRVLSATTRWAEILAAASDPEITVVVSNTTEAGLSLARESIVQDPPRSFPAKLTACLWERYKKLGEEAPLLLVIPTELIPDNGTLLKSMVDELIAFNQLEPEFSRWLQRYVLFCNSLVDRIVTRPAGTTIGTIPGRDTLAIQTEPYRLWAIEGGEAVKKILSFASCDTGVIIDPDIRYYRERKLRLLNGTHTIMVCLGFLRGHDTVYQCMQNSELRLFAESVMKEEILPTLTLGTAGQNHAFANEVIDRFSNPFTEHFLLNITLQSTLKMKMRIVPSLIAREKSPNRIAEGFAAYLLFMKAVAKDDNGFFGLRKEKPYPIRDDAAEYFHDVWRTCGVPGVVHTVCRNLGLWGHDLSRISGFEQAVGDHLTRLHSQP